MKTPRLKILTLMLLIGCIPSTVRGIGLSVTPATVSLKSVPGKEASASFSVSNPSKEVGLFETYPEEFEELFTLIPSRFVLEAGESREVLVRANRREVGIIRTTIAIEAQPLGLPSQAVGGGVRLPVSLEVSEGTPFLSAVLLSGARGAWAWSLLGALTVFFLIRRVSLSTLKRVSRRRTL